MIQVNRPDPRRICRWSVQGRNPAAWVPSPQPGGRRDRFVATTGDHASQPRHAGGEGRQPPGRSCDRTFSVSGTRTQGVDDPCRPSCVLLHPSRGQAVHLYYPSQRPAPQSPRTEGPAWSYTGWSGPPGSIPPACQPLATAQSLWRVPWRAMAGIAGDTEPRATPAGPHEATNFYARGGAAGIKIALTGFTRNLTETERCSTAILPC